MKEQRFQQILDILDTQKFASVEMLSKTLFVSMPTVRRDLSELQEMGLIARSHGGALLKDSDFIGSPIAFRNGINTSEKQLLSIEASKLLHDNCTIFLDESSTTFNIIREIPKYQNIRVVTNSLPALLELYKYHIPCYCLGGEFVENTMSYVGSMTEEMVARIGIDIMFFSSSALSARGLIADYSDTSTSLRRKVCEQTNTIVFLCDKSKFGKNGSYVLMPVSKVDYFITNGNFPYEINFGSAKIIKI